MHPSIGLGAAFPHFDSGAASAPVRMCLCAQRPAASGCDQCSECCTNRHHFHGRFKDLCCSPLFLSPFSGEELSASRTCAARVTVALSVQPAASITIPSTAHGLFQGCLPQKQCVCATDAQLRPAATSAVSVVPISTIFTGEALNLFAPRVPSPLEVRQRHTRSPRSRFPLLVPAHHRMHICLGAFPLCCG